MMVMARFGIAVGVCAALAIGCSQEGTTTPTETRSADEIERPHMVILVADDMGQGDWSLSNAEVRTPRLEELAAQGTRLAHFHAFPLCTPSRVALLTGRSPLRYGLARSPLPPWSEDGLPSEARTLPEALTDVGYKTVAIGKWHLGHRKPEFHPLSHGFQTFYGFLNGAIDSFTHESREGGHDWQRDGISVKEEGYATHLLADEAVRTIEQHNAEQPLFLYVAFKAPHRPLQAPPETLSQFRDHPDAERAAFLAMMSELDSAIGRIVASVDSRSDFSNTLVLFLSDNGAALDSGGNNGDLRGGKASTFQGGLNVPAIVRWPTRVPTAGLDHGFRSVLDVAPSLASAAGAVMPDTDGQDWQGDLFDPAGTQLVDRGNNAPGVAFVTQSGDRVQYAYFKGRWKYLRSVNRSDGEVREFLHRIDTDPLEEKNAAKRQEARVAELRSELEQWLALDPKGLALDEFDAISREHDPKWKAPADWSAGANPRKGD